jgi:hypothetical protein
MCLGELGHFWFFVGLALAAGFKSGVSSTLDVSPIGHGATRGRLAAFASREYSIAISRLASAFSSADTMSMLPLFPLPFQAS